MSANDLFMACALVVAGAWLVLEWRAERRRQAEHEARLARISRTGMSPWRVAERKLVADVERWLREGAE